MLAGLVPEPPSEMEEAQEDDERVPVARGAATIHGSVSVRHDERLAVRVRRHSLAWHDTDATYDNRVAARAANGDTEAHTGAVSGDAGSPVQRRGIRRRYGAQPALSLPLLAPVRDDVVVRLSPAERRHGAADGVADDVTDDVRNAGHGRNLAGFEHRVVATESARTCHEWSGWFPLRNVVLQV